MSPCCYDPLNFETKELGEAACANHSRQPRGHVKKTTKKKQDGESVLEEVPGCGANPRSLGLGGKTTKQKKKVPPPAPTKDQKKKKKKHHHQKKKNQTKKPQPHDPPKPHPPHHPHKHRLPLPNKTNPQQNQTASTPFFYWNFFFFIWWVF